MRDYLKVMGMSDRLFAAMMEVPSHRMRMLTHRETVAFGLSSGEAATKATVLYALDSSSVRSRLSARRPATAGRGKSMEAARPGTRGRGAYQGEASSRLPAATCLRESGSFIVKVHRDRAALAGAVGLQRRLRLMLLRTLARESFSG
jgi:hypothetical protein